MEPADLGTDDLWHGLVEADFEELEPGLGDPDLPLDPPGDPEPERGRGPIPAEADPELGAGFTLVLCGTPAVFGLITLGIFNAPAFWGPLGAVGLAAVFGGAYLGLFWWGSRWLEGHRHA